MAKDTPDGEIKEPVFSMKPWRDALMIALKRPVGGKKNVRMIQLVADRCVAMAATGEMSAIKEIADRLDGKAALTMTSTVTNIRQVSDDDLDRRIAERLAEANIALASKPRGQAGLAPNAGRAGSSDADEEVRSKPH